MIDNRELFQDKKWERNCLFAAKHKRSGASVYKEDSGCACHAYVESLGMLLVYIFGSEEECIEAVKKHNNELKMKDLLLDKVNKPQYANFTIDAFKIEGNSL